LYLYPLGRHLRSTAGQPAAGSRPTLLQKSADMHGRALPLLLTPHAHCQMYGCLPARARCLAARDTWQGGDHERWPVFCKTLIDPCPERPGISSPETPAWIRSLRHMAATPHEKYDPTSRCPAQ
jgi:hypothetical protein